MSWEAVSFIRISSKTVQWKRREEVGINTKARLPSRSHQEQGWYFHSDFFKVERVIASDFSLCFLNQMKLPIPIPLYQTFYLFCSLKTVCFHYLEICIIIILYVLELLRGCTSTQCLICLICHICFSENCWKSETKTFPLLEPTAYYYI